MFSYCGRLPEISCVFIVGTLLATPLAAYIVHLWLASRRE